MTPSNILFFLGPAVILIAIFLFLPYIKRIKEPFGYQAPTPLDDSIFLKTRTVYYRKILLFSIPFTLSLTITNIYVSDPTLGSALLALLVLGLAGVNFIFYLQAYSVIKKHFIHKTTDDKPSMDDSLPESW